MITERWLVDNEWRRRYKEAEVAYLKVLSRNLTGRTEETKETSVRIVGIRVEIRPRNLVKRRVLTTQPRRPAWLLLKTAE
jgi:hypothetical protein